MNIKKLILEELRNILLEEEANPDDVKKCFQQVGELKKFPFFPFLGIRFFTIDKKSNEYIGSIVFQADYSNPEKSAWYDLSKPGTNFYQGPAKIEELYAAAKDCLVKRCPKGTPVNIKSDPSIKAISITPMTDNDIKNGSSRPGNLEGVYECKSVEQPILEAIMQQSAATPQNIPQTQTRNPDRVVRSTLYDKNNKPIEDMQAWLDKTALVIIDKKNKNALITVHDNGAGDAQSRTAQQAEELRKYLVSRGVPSEQLIMKPMGSSLPDYRPEMAVLGPHRLEIYFVDKQKQVSEFNFKAGDSVYYKKKPELGFFTVSKILSDNKIIIKDTSGKELAVNISSYAKKGQ